MSVRARFEFSSVVSAEAVFLEQPLWEFKELIWETNYVKLSTFRIRNLKTISGYEVSRKRKKD